jgi:hypothetical protein
VKTPFSIRYVAGPIFSIDRATTWYVGARSAVASSSFPVFSSTRKTARVPDIRVGPWSMTTLPSSVAVFVGKS